MRSNWIRCGNKQNPDSLRASLTENRVGCRRVNDILGRTWDESEISWLAEKYEMLESVELSGY